MESMIYVIWKKNEVLLNTKTEQKGMKTVVI